jgi:hypothetical protein
VLGIEADNSWAKSEGEEEGLLDGSVRISRKQRTDCTSRALCGDKDPSDRWLHGCLGLSGKNVEMDKSFWDRLIDISHGQFVRGKN